MLSRPRYGPLLGSFSLAESDRPVQSAGVPATRDFAKCCGRATIRRSPQSTRSMQAVRCQMGTPVGRIDCGIARTCIDQGAPTVLGGQTECWLPISTEEFRSLLSLCPNPVPRRQVAARNVALPVPATTPARGTLLSVQFSRLPPRAWGWRDISPKSTKQSWKRVDSRCNTRNSRNVP